MAKGIGNGFPMGAVVTTPGKEGTVKHVNLFTIHIHSFAVLTLLFCSQVHTKYFYLSFICHKSILS